MSSDRILLGHGSGGRLSHDLLRAVFLPRFRGEALGKLADAAILEVPGGRIAFTTDSFVVKPLFFPGGDIGRLSVCGTVNDLAVMGAVPRYLSCGFILEEGMELATLERVLDSMRAAADEAGVEVVTGDTKVVERGGADGLFINTSGIGIVPPGVDLSAGKIRVGDRVILSGSIGEHGVAVLAQREGLRFQSPVRSDCAPLQGLAAAVLKSPEGVRFMRDPTRGGLATTLNEIVERREWGLRIDEDAVPVAEPVRGLCEVLGLDPLYVANEGKLVAVTAPEDAGRALDAIKAHPLGAGGRIIGEVVEKPKGRVAIRSSIGGLRIADMLTGEPLPRIC
jgi:hydrogenase expression/formation protein HypE